MYSRDDEQVTETDLLRLCQCKESSVRDLGFLLRDALLLLLAQSFVKLLQSEVAFHLGPGGEMLKSRRESGRRSRGLLREGSGEEG